MLGQALPVAKLGGAVLQLFNKGVGRAVAQHTHGAVVEDGHGGFQRRVQSLKNCGSLCELLKDKSKGYRLK